MKNTLPTLKVIFVQILLFLSFSSFSQCNIDFVVADVTACEEELFDVSINFEHENTSDQFVITGNGTNYGTFSYSDLPVILTSLSANCETPYEFVVTDANDNDCSDFVELGTVCCEGACEIISIDFGPNPICVEGFIVTEWFIFAENISEVGFDIFINNDFLLFVAYNPNNGYNFDIPDTETEYFTIKVCDNDNENCCLSWEVMNPCFEEEVCIIGEISVELGDCIDGLFDLTIDFESANTSDQFTVAGNGINYGTFSYAQLPISLSALEGNCSTEYEFLVTDVNDNDCSNFYELGTVCCNEIECDLFDLMIETSECDGNVYTVTFDFEYTGTTNNFFDWEIPGIGSGFAEFGNLPLTISVENTNTNVLTLQINENDNADCDIEGAFENPCYEGECFIGELNVEVSECNNDNMFFVVINFEYTNTSDQFTLNGNGNSYGTFSYADLPITIDGLEGNCDLEYEFVVHDVNNNDCASDIGIGVVCCDGDECDLFDLVIETSECDGNVYTVTFDFEYTGTTNNFFDWEIPGIGSGFAEFSDLPLTVTVENTNVNSYTIFINENDNIDCAIEGVFENPCYEGECFIGELNVEVSECNNDNMFFVVINFEYTNTSDQFTLNGNGNSYGTFSYADLPITIDGLEGNCDLEYEFVVHDVNNNDCASDIGIGVVCCDGDECNLFDLVLETSECDGNVYTVTFDFEYTGTTNNFFDWEIPGIGSGFAEFGDLPLTISLENTNTNVLTLQINENDNADCDIEGTFENPCFDSEECFIGELNVEVSECNNDNMFFVVINFEYTNTSDQFTLNGNGNSYGTFSYADLPITIDGLEGNCDLEYEFVVHDVNNNDCASDIGIGVVCCDGDECDLFDLVLETSECDGNVYTVTFDFEYTGTTNNFFDWEIPGIGSGFAEFGNLPLTISVENTNTNVLTLQINENDNADCDIEGAFENPCYEGECFIGELNVEVSECNNDNMFFVVINFEYTNTSDQFTLNGNGNSYGTFSYADLPITIDGLEGNCDLEYEFVVHDVNNNDCASDIGIGVVCCDGDECDLFDLVIETSECDGNVYTVTFDFEYTGTTNNFFDWEIPGIGSGFAEFSDLPLTVTVENTNVNSYTIFINENDNIDCAIEGVFENPCYEGECFIGELNVEVSECNNDNMFFVVINFEYTNTSDQFTLNGNGNSYGTFSYADLPITIDGLEGNCDLEYEFVVHDVNNNDCASDIGIGVVCCDGDECDLFDLNFEVSECDGNTFIVEVDFEYNGNSNELFDWEIPGVGSGTSSYADLPITIEIENTTDSQFTFFANENDNPDCSIVGTFGNPCFDPEACFIDDVSAEVILCEENLFDIEINFDYSSVGSTFSIVGNDGVEYGTFEYNDLPVIISELSADCDTEYEFVIIDLENEECSDFVELGAICCEDFNQINGIDSEAIIDGESFKITLNIENTTLKGCSIEVYVGGELFTTLNSNESSFELGPFNCGQDNVIEIQLINTCTGEGLTFDLDLSDIECVTDIKVNLDSIDLRWNMTQKILSIDGEIPILVNIQLLNTQGALIFAESKVRNGWIVNFETLPSGLYFVRIVDSSSNNSKGFIRKILIY